MTTDEHPWSGDEYLIAATNRGTARRTEPTGDRSKTAATQVIRFLFAAS